MCIYVYQIKYALFVFLLSNGCDKISLMKICIILSLFDQRLKFVHDFECNVDLSNPYNVPFSFFFVQVACSLSLMISMKHWYTYVGCNV